VRIVGGELSGRRLRAPRGAATRPTSDRVKEALFNILGRPAAGARVLDLYAGSGALGLEALSRGCAEAVLIERAAPALTALRANISALGLAERARVIADDAARAVTRLVHSGERFDWIFADPPYAAGEQAERLLGQLAPLCAPEAVIAYEHAARTPAPERAPGLARYDERRWGDTCVTLYQPTPAAAGRAA
jgi:16S rRNA (guanine(966)-N(2))-methyltransferase RsmD